MSEKTISILLCGVGGQGILLASAIAAKAAILAGYDVKTNEVHGMAQRGGSVTASVRFGRNVHSPLIELGGADAMLSLEAIEAIRCHQYLKAGGVAVVSMQRVIPITVSSGRAEYPCPDEILPALFPRLRFIDAIAEAQVLGNPKTANVLLLGALAAMSTHLPASAWEEALRECVPPKHLDINLKAFHKGAEAAKP